MRADRSGRTDVSSRTLLIAAASFAGLLLIALGIVAASGEADPVAGAEQGLEPATVIVNASVIVFREGLEAVLILAAIMASLLGVRQGYRRPIALGAGAAFGATIVTWFAMQGVLGMFSAYNEILLALTGLLAIVVLLIVMNWFFHKVYWTDHIAGLNKRKRDLVSESEQSGRALRWSFVLLGFSAVYREGFEVVLFLQNLQLAAGTSVVMKGVVLGLIGTAIVGALTFLYHHKLPYKRMLVLTGVLLGIVLVVMVGGTARTLQSLGWIPTTPLPVAFPDWWARWFEIVPTWESLLMQAAAAGYVFGTYHLAERAARRRRDAARGTGACGAAPTIGAVMTPPMSQPSPTPEPSRVAPMAGPSIAGAAPLMPRPMVVARTSAVEAVHPVRVVEQIPVAAPVPTLLPSPTLLADRPAPFSMPTPIGEVLGLRYSRREPSGD